jgi:hypothetical protein
VLTLSEATDTTAQPTTLITERRAAVTTWACQQEVLRWEVVVGRRRLRFEEPE